MEHSDKIEGKPSRRERERARRRDEIMDAAIRVFSRKGFDSATLDEIAQEAEFSKGALYLYFSSKEDILFNILIGSIHHTFRIYAETLLGKRSFREELTDLYIRFARMMLRHQDEIQIIMAQFTAGFNDISAEGRRKITETHDEATDLLNARIQQAYAAGEIRDVPITAIVCMIHGSLDNLIMSRWGIDSIEQAPHIVETFMEMLFQGIAKERKTCA